jgi:hypothetical protein
MSPPCTREIASYLFLPDKNAVRTPQKNTDQFALQYGRHLRTLYSVNFLCGRRKCVQEQRERYKHYRCRNRDINVFAFRSHWPEMVRGCLPSGQLSASFGKAARCESGCEEDERAVSGTIWAALALTTRKKKRIRLREETILVRLVWSLRRKIEIPGA